MDRRSRRAPQRGFTLLEIMVVITLIGLVTGVAVNLFDAWGDAQVKVTRTQIHQVQESLVLYRMRHGRLPATSEGLAALVTDGLLPSVPLDGWSRDFAYLSEGGTYQIVSYGEDGSPGGTGKAADISSNDLKRPRK